MFVFVCGMPRAGHGDVSISMQVESSVQIVCKAGAQSLEVCRRWVLLACIELARQATKDDLSRPTGPRLKAPTGSTGADAIARPSYRHGMHFGSVCLSVRL